MKAASKLALVALIASCNGRCSAKDAVFDEVRAIQLGPQPPMECVYDRGKALCVIGDQFISCVVDDSGFARYRATCRTRGRLIMTPEMPPP